MYLTTVRTEAHNQQLQDQQLYNKVNLVATLNESKNANDYINVILRNESNRISVETDKVKREQYKLRSKLMADSYLSGYYATGKWVVVLTIFVTIVLMTPAALWRAGKMSMRWFASIVLVVLLVYTAAVVAVSAKTAMRRIDAWNQYSWPVTKDMAKALKQAEKNASLTSQCNTLDNTREHLEGICAEACAQYSELYGAQINAWKEKNSWTTGLTQSLLPWAHYNVEGKSNKNVWPGAACNSVATCTDATLIYKHTVVKNPSGTSSTYGDSIPVGTTVYNDHLSKPNNVWAGADGTPC